MTPTIGLPPQNQSFFYVIVNDTTNKWMTAHETEDEAKQYLEAWAKCSKAMEVNWSFSIRHIK